MAQKRLSLRLRLLAYFLAVAAIGLIGLGSGFALLLATSRAAIEQYDRITRPSSALMRVSIVLQRMATGVRDVIIADNDSDLGRAMSYLDGQDADMESAASEYLGCPLPAESRERFKAFQGKLEPYRANIAELAAKAGRNERSTFSSSLKALRSQAQGLQASLDSLASEMDTRAFSQAKAARSSVILAMAFFAAFGILCVALSVALALVSSRSIALPMRRMGEVSRAIAEGDLSKGLSGEAIGRQDEIGALASSIAGMKAGLLANIEHIKAATGSLSEMGSTLSRNAQAASTAAAAIVASVAQAKSRVVDQSAGVSETSATTEQILKSIAALDGQIEEQAGSVASSSSSVEEMVASIRAVTKSVELLGASFAELGSASESGNRMLSDMSARIASISSQSEKLDEANGAVSSIATQTNLLAMNAAIEAAHAGQAGKGFAVVADEIRKLAESAGIQSKEISRDIGEIKESIAAIVPSSEETSKAFSEILRLISTLLSMEEEIKRAMLEQSEGSKDVLGAIERIEEVTANVRRGSSEIREGSKSIAREMRELLDGSVALSSAMEEIERISASVDGVSGDVRVIAEGATAQVSILSDLVSRYKLPEGAAGA